MNKLIIVFFVMVTFWQNASVYGGDNSGKFCFSWHHKSNANIGNTECYALNGECEKFRTARTTGVDAGGNRHVVDSSCVGGSPAPKMTDFSKPAFDKAPITLTCLAGFSPQQISGSKKCAKKILGDKIPTVCPQGSMPFLEGCLKGGIGKTTCPTKLNKMHEVPGKDFCAPNTAQWDASQKEEATCTKITGGDQADNPRYLIDKDGLPRDFCIRGVVSKRSDCPQKSGYKVTTVGSGSTMSCQYFKWQYQFSVVK